jgi:AcrR family transcriptional regulator
MRDAGAADEARRRVIARARQLFERRGFSAVTMDEIATGLGMSKKTLYQLFPNKEELGGAALDETFQEIDREIEAARGSADRDFGEQLRDHFFVVAERYRRLETALLEDLERGNPALSARYQALSRGLMERQFGSLLAAGVKAGEFRSDLDPRFVVRAVEALSAGMLRPAALNALGLSPLQAFQGIFDILLNGIRVREAPGSKGASRKGRK